jgi:hypothetical protein
MISYAYLWRHIIEQQDNITILDKRIKVLATAVLELKGKL